MRVVTNVCGAISELCKYQQSRESFRVNNGLPLMIDLLNYIWEPLLENVPLVIKECATEPESMQIIEKYDGVRLVWSLLKHRLPSIQANAAWALVTCIKNAQNSGEMVREFVGGLELLIKLLQSKDVYVLAATCAVLGEVAKDKENLGVLTDYGYIPMLVNLLKTKDSLLRENLATAIAYSCSWGNNIKELGRLGAITPLVIYLAETDNPLSVKRATALALYHLSDNVFNCITMHECLLVKFLTRYMSSKDEVLQESIAGCVANIRNCVLEAETFHLIDKGFCAQSESSM